METTDGTLVVFMKETAKSYIHESVYQNQFCAAVEVPDTKQVVHEYKTTFNTEIRLNYYMRTKSAGLAVKQNSQNTPGNITEQTHTHTHTRTKTYNTCSSRQNMRRRRRRRTEKER